MNRLQPKNYLLPVFFLIILLAAGCATRQGYQGAGVGAITGTTAGILLDPGNRWRGAVIGGGMGALLGGALTEPRVYRNSYHNPTYYPAGTSYSGSSYTAGRGALIGGVTGATAGALLDNSNSWRGSLIGGVLGSFFGGGIGAINSGPSIPVLWP